MSKIQSKITPHKNQNGELLFNLYRVSICEDTKILEMDGGNGYTTQWMYLMPLNCIFKSGSYGIFYVYFTTIKKTTRKMWSVFKEKTTNNRNQPWDDPEHYLQANILCSFYDCGRWYKGKYSQWVNISSREMEIIKNQMEVLKLRNPVSEKSTSCLKYYMFFNILIFLGGIQI